MKITRVAPSPTGYAHMGFVRTALQNYLAAKSSGGKFIVRIDDTDKARSTKEFEDNLLQTLAWLGITYDEIHWQSKRVDRHRAAVDRLLSENKATVGNEGEVRLKVVERVPEWTDEVNGTIKISDKEFSAIDGMVLLRSDKSPVFHLASVVDDIELGVNTIIRGADHISNTGKHVHIYKALGADLPSFSHVGLIFFNGKKLSKRDHESSMKAYAEYPPQAVLQAVLRLGWSHPNPKFDKEYPLVSPELAVEKFLEGSLRAAKSTLDLGKLEWLRKKWQMKLS